MTATWAGDPRTWTAGDLAAADLNTEIRDRLDWIHAALQAAGIYSTGTPTLLSDAHTISVTGIQNVTSGSDTLLQVDALEFTSGSEYGYGSTGVESISAGVYWLGAQVSYAESSAGQRQAWFDYEGTQYNRVIAENAGTGRDTALYTACLIEMAADKTVHLYCRQNSGSTLSTTFRLQMMRVSV